MPKGCRPCCRRIEPAGWRGADSRLRLSAVPRPGDGEGCPERIRNAHRVAESEKIVQGHLPASADRGQSAFASIERQGCSRCADSCARYSAPRSSACTQRWSRLPPKAKSSACSSAGRPPTGSAAARPWKGSMRRAWTTMAARRRASAPSPPSRPSSPAIPTSSSASSLRRRSCRATRKAATRCASSSRYASTDACATIRGCSWPSAPGRAIPGASSARATRSPATPSTRGTPRWLAAASPVPRRISPG